MTAKDRYLTRVRAALTMSTVYELPRAEYIEALEELAADIDGMLEAARQEAKNDAVR